MAVAIAPSVLGNRQTAVRAIIALLLVVWCAVWPFLPQDRLGDPTYTAMVNVFPSGIAGLAVWAFLNHLLRRRWLSALLLTPAISFLLAVTGGATMMLSAFLARGGTMPL